MLIFPFLWFQGICASQDEVSVTYKDPRLFNGRMQMQYHKPDAPPPEPLNIIIPWTDRGQEISSTEKERLSNWFNAIGFASDCLGVHKGDYFYAQVDDRGEQEQQLQYREVIGSRAFGSCLESLTGGNHFRAFRQMETGAWFLGASVERNVLRHHTVSPNGYNQGRDSIIKAALKGASRGKCHWSPAVVTMEKNFAGITEGTIFNHNITVDGVVAIIQVPEPVCK